MSDFTDQIIDGPEMPARGTYWRSKFQEERERVQQKNKTIAALRAENKRLREALEQCGEWIELELARNSAPCESASPKSDGSSRGGFRILQEARGALAGEEQPNA